MSRVFIQALSLTLCALVVSRPVLAADDGDADGDAKKASPKSDEPSSSEIPPEEPKIAPPPPEPEPKRAPNSIYVEGLGAALLYSINYERLVTEDLGIRGGFSYLGVTASAGTANSSVSFITIPITASYLGVGSKHNMLEVGGGLTLFHASGSASGVGVSSSGSGTAVLPEALVGYRLHPVDGAGFQFRIGAMFFVGKGLGLSNVDPDKVGVLPWLYVSLGASF